MNVYIDESGSFVSAPKKGAWNVVVAVAAPESSRTRIERAVRELKQQTSTHQADEIKLNGLSEAQYLAFLSNLHAADILLFGTATDAGLNKLEIVAAHQRVQVARVRENVPRMKYEGGRRGVELLASQLESLPPQLYAQLVCQVDLLHNVVQRSINYYAQRVPASLREFRWRIDQKNSSRTAFEDAFEKIAPMLLQTRSLREPGARVEGFDYRHLKQYEFTDGDRPEYMVKAFGAALNHSINVQKLVRGNLKFQDSRANSGVQVADLLASGLRRCLRLRFGENPRVAAALGRLMLQNARGKFPISLVSFMGGSIESEDTAKVVKSFARSSKRMLVS